jgi:hypothetical protein
MFVSTNIKLSEEACRRIKSDMQEIHVDLHDYDKHVGKVDSMDLFQTLHPIEQAMEDYSAKFYQTADESDLDDDY